MRFSVGILAIALVLVVGGAQSQQGKRAAEPAGADKPQSGEELVARGEYLANYVAMCVICHSPKDDRGQVIVGQEFMGAAIPLDSPFPRGERWATRAPALGPMAVGQEAAVLNLLMTGKWSTGETPLMPMPPFRMNEDDARAVVAYLKTL